MFERLRIGSGIDVHEFVEGRPLILGGVQIPHSKGLLGHSDADAVLHALVDSVLGALGEGDIGQHFSPSDPRWKDASSRDFVRFVRGRLDVRGARLINVDLTLLLESPKIAPHIPAMKTAIAEDLNIDLDRIHIKATTSEGLGFVGRKEGVLAMASCLVELGG
jgi:2-C-methyl-D-erythritol 2,4-cyclodiphosphate synthase